MFGTVKHLQFGVCVNGDKRGLVGTVEGVVLHVSLGKALGHTSLIIPYSLCQPGAGTVPLVLGNKCEKLKKSTTLVNASYIFFIND